MGVFFEGARAEIFVIDTSMRVQRGLKFFPPESKERRVCAFDDSYKISTSLFDFDTKNDTFEETL